MRFDTVGIRCIPDGELMETGKENCCPSSLAAG